MPSRLVIRIVADNINPAVSIQIDQSCQLTIREIAIQTVQIIGRGSLFPES